MNVGSRYMFFVVLMVLGTTCVCVAQPGSDPNDGAAPGAPISGIEILIGLGGLLGAKKLFAARKKN
jgi:hypothetical protein